MYTITSPSLDGLIIHDPMYFEGIRRPFAMYAVHDSDDHIPILERYYHDISSLFMKKFTSFSTSESVSNTEAVKLQALLQEMIKVKILIQKGQENDCEV